MGRGVGVGDNNQSSRNKQQRSDQGASKALIMQLLQCSKRQRHHLYHSIFVSSVVSQAKAKTPVAKNSYKNIVFISYFVLYSVSYYV